LELQPIATARRFGLQLTLITDYLDLLTTAKPTFNSHMWVAENKVEDKMKQIVNDLRDLE